MSDNPADVLPSFMTTQLARPLGAAQLASGRTLQPFSAALCEGADNLLGKAMDALEAGDQPSATRYIDRAAALPYDEHEESQPAEWSARMMLFDEVIDAMEIASESDSTWLTTAIAVLDRAEGAGAIWMRDTLSSVAADFVLTRREEKLIRSVVGVRHAEPDFGLGRDSPAGDVAEVTLSVLNVTRAYHAALYHD